MPLEAWFPCVLYNIKGVDISLVLFKGERGSRPPFLRGYFGEKCITIEYGCVNMGYNHFFNVREKQVVYFRPTNDIYVVTLSQSKNVVRVMSNFALRSTVSFFVCENDILTIFKVPHNLICFPAHYYMLFWSRCCNPEIFHVIFQSHAPRHVTIFTDNPVIGHRNN